MYDLKLLEADSIVARVDELRAELDAMRPLEADRVGQAMQRLRLEWTYHSNAIEGNSLTYGETRALLMHGVTAKGKPLKDHLDIKGHREALDYLERVVQGGEPLRLVAIREMHKLLLGEPYEMWAGTPDGQRVRRTITPGQFKTQRNHVVTATGEVHYYARPEEVPALMQDLVDWARETMEQAEAGDLHPIPFAADLHHRFAAIHPFDDGNGRMARLLMNLVLMRTGYVPAVIRQDRRPAYYGALAEADGGELGPLVQFVSEELAATLDLFLRALRGEADPDSFGHRVALLRREIETDRSDVERSPEVLKQVALQFVAPLLTKLDEGISILEPFFNEVRKLGIVTLSNGRRSSPGDHMSEVLPELEWINFSRHYTLMGYLKDPAKQILLIVKGSAGKDHVSITASQVGEIRISYDQTPNEQEALQFADRVLEKVMEKVEAIHRQSQAD